MKIRTRLNTIPATIALGFSLARLWWFNRRAAPARAKSRAAA